jgi:aldehyde:ferredoxin oxidoreductase
MFFHPPKMDIRIFETKILAAVTGLDLTPDQLWETGERIWSLRRAVMAKRENRSREADTLSHVWFEGRVRGDQLARPIDRAKWELLKDRYYSLLGWDNAKGWPTRARLEKLGMKSVADTLQASGKLG